MRPLGLAFWSTKVPASQVRIPAASSSGGELANAISGPRAWRVPEHREPYPPAFPGGTARSLNTSPLIFAPQVPGIFTSRLTSS